ncbi:hypothetical protein GCM10027290_61520 [Micromonospora sonneratiae]|uniref:Uncharacterized protein n=1 Tax=Micromonospora sonneratiae TaxID=1184706 RepID=A0ABW3YJY2_9ACTN
MAVAVKPEDIETLAGKLEKLCVDLIDPFFTSLPSSSISPGNFPDGTALSLHYDLRKGEVEEELADLRKLLTQTVSALKNVAAEYRRSGDDASAVMTELDELVAQVKEYLPGLKL